jgi:hypothetical protein
MRSLCVPLCLVAALAFVAGCEDGPDQPYSPAPANAASTWTNPEVDAAVANGNQEFDAGYPTVGKTTLCSTDFKRQRWAWMLTQPVSPPRFYAGIDMAGGNLWKGLTIEDAEQPPSDPLADAGGLCQSVPQGAEGTCPSGIGACNGNYWGNNQEVSFSWNVSTHLLDQMVLALGYTGPVKTITFPDHTGAMHAYSMAIGDVMRRDGQPFLLNWNSSGEVEVQITDFFNAMMATFATPAGIAWNTSSCSDDSTCGPVEVCQCTHDATNTSSCVGTTKGQCGDANCGTDGYCLVYPAAWIFGVRPMVFYVVGTAGTPQPELSTPIEFYNFWYKWEPFSNLPQDIELGANGPVATGTPIGAANPATVCTQQIGLTFGDMTTNCVQVHGDSANPNGVDAVNLDKVEYGLQHDQEHWTSNVMGVHQNFTSLKVANDPNIVVLDTDTPQPGDIAQDWSWDLFARGQTANDYNTTNGNLEERGSSLVFIEWARLMLNDIAKMIGLATPHTLGDACTGFSASGAPNYQSQTGCSGVEGLIIPGQGATNGYGDFSQDPLRPDLNPVNNWDDVVNWYASVLKPGDLTGAVCIDPLTQTDCDDTIFPQNLASIWENMFNHVIRVMGKGNVLNLPAELQDVRYYFKWFGVAFLKYLKAYGNYPLATRDSFPNGTAGGGIGPSDVMTQPFDQESLFFDYDISPGVGGAQTFDQFEYVDRDYIGTGAGGTYNWIPWDFSYGSDILGGNQRYDDWYRRMDREEIAMYSAMLTDKTHTAGQENNVNITNLFGNAILPGNWPTYACATGQYSDPTVAGGNECGGLNPPLDPTNPSNQGPCDATCPAAKACVTATSYVNGVVSRCAPLCDYTTYPNSGCGPSQACVLTAAGNAGCVDMQMDKNGANPCISAGPQGSQGVPLAACPAPSVVEPHPLLWYYAGTWGQTPFSAGHSSITLAPSDQQPDIGCAKITIPNFAAGPYTPSPILAESGGDAGACPMGYTVSSDGVWCYAALNSGTGNLAPSFTPLTPWLAVGTGFTENGGPVGFSIPEDGQRDQFVTTGQLDFTGVLETYVVDYVPYQDPAQPSCVTTGTCNPGFTCNTQSNLCIANDNSIRVEGIEADDFLGQVFLCQDAATGDILHVGMYDSAASILSWFAAHPGQDSNPDYGSLPNAQTQCSVLVRSSSANLAVQQITSLAYGVELNFSAGQGQGRVSDILVFDTKLIQAF